MSATTPFPLDAARKAPAPAEREAADREHFAQLYVDDEVLIDSVAEYVRQGIEAGASAIAIATGAHRAGLERRWSGRGFDAQAASGRGELVLLDAAETLATFTVGGALDRERFFARMGEIFAPFARRAGRILIFGEMVSLLWREGRPEAAVELERLWNELARHHLFTLFCAYSLDDCAGREHLRPFEAICASHTRVIPVESYVSLSPREQQTAIAQLQQKAYTLETELQRQSQSQQTSAHLAAIVESSDDAIVSKTLEGRIQSWNAAAERIFGYSAAEAIGQSITMLIPPERLAEEEEILATLRRGGRIDHFETTRIAKDGRRIEVSLTVSPVRDAAGVVIGASKVARDITARRRSEEALQERDQALRQAHGELQARTAELEALNRHLRQEIAHRERVEAALRDADRRKDEFLALLAHELRNPLAPIRYALATNRKTERTPEQRRRAEEIIERQVTHMSRLLDDLLDVSRITRGTLELKKSTTELTLVLGSAIETARPLLDAKHHTLSLDLPADAVRLQADPVRLEQVFSNLLINAAKYTDPEGQIQLRATHERRQVVVSVRDNGIGIAPEMMPRLFTIFAQANSALERAEGGLGVGLSLVRGLVSLHGGTVEARSDGPGRGSEFIVRLPLGPKAEEPPELDEDGAAAAAGRSLRVLIAEDNRDAADTCATLLEVLGHRVETAYCAQRALEIAERFHPHVLLLDIGLPDLNGYELARKVRAASWAKRAVLIAVTGWGQEEDQRRALEAGFDHHLTKPLAPEALESLLQAVSGTLRGEPGRERTRS
jgi:PAS domain S-box-containing protein